MTSRRVPDRIRHAINKVTVMGDATSMAGTLVMHPLACNNIMDPSAARAVCASLSREVPVFAVSRFAAAQVDDATFHGSLNSVAKHVLEVAQKSTQYS